MIRHSRLFKESALAHQLLDGLSGIEIGGSYHNAFGLDTLNVDYTDDMTTSFKLDEIALCGEALPVDIVAPGDQLPIETGGTDFVISSHVVEHFFDPIAAIREWMRVSRKYIFIIVPLRDALPSDRDLPITQLVELIERNTGVVPNPAVDTHEHCTRWEAQGFLEMLNWIYAQDWGQGWATCAVEVPDLKVGNGMAFALKRTL
jgi:SAM-dependent methyltransferase